ncbi:MAG: peptide-methionine (R)-S-oxide reductase [Gallionellales bacterium RIFCSPLOWO2_12_FULL_59_22]|nr:MAG: peptide-methionine (R)-S-oxide reductase [Gallionellales bacterium RIFCSPLOWO2_02_FULL_59_110]OGT14057.1 MAG: peptide-methionine (R)-S-oxide reductase [Gallionellales bacterium RIFCSPLOWO2_12_FULL_59_22]
MERRTFLNRLTGMSLLLLMPVFARGAQGMTPLIKSRSEWRALLPSARYEILFEEGTEPAHSSPLDDEKRNGTFVCAACFLPLFSSAHKYDSGTGWPSFWQPLADAVATKTDFKLVWPRTEYHCARCGGHQGHVFKDGPQPTGLRYCNNGLALEFVPQGTPLPELRT